MCSALFLSVYTFFSGNGSSTSVTWSILTGGSLATESVKVKTMYKLNEQSSYRASLTRKVLISSCSLSWAFSPFSYITNNDSV